MKIGLVMTNYMYRSFLPWSCRSLQAQTRKPDYAIFLDDASMDDSVEIVKKHFADLFDDIIVNEKNLGMVASTNKGINLLIEKGCEYVCVLSSDDIFHSDYLLKTEKALSKAKKDVAYAYTWVRRIGLENQVDAHPEWNKEILMKAPYVHGSALVKAEAWGTVGGLPNAPKEEDWLFYKNLAELGWKGILVPEPLLIWRKHNQFCRTQYSDNNGRVLAWEKQKKG